MRGHVPRLPLVLNSSVRPPEYRTPMPLCGASGQIAVTSSDADCADCRAVLDRENAPEPGATIA